MKRSENEKNDLIKYATQELIIKLLEIIDSFELALKQNHDEGIKLIYSKLYKILESQGLSKIKTTGQFDPNLHEALINEEGNVDNEIIEELQSGFLLNERVIRAAKVKISKLKSTKNENE